MSLSPSANKLAGSSSPYLLQHAHNPVAWHLWGPEAFEEARRRDVPIFLSIGYSTCYWCHVMERESFESQQTAAVMNELYVNIKLDREQRPDIDELYMAAVQMLTGSGGWPMSVFLEPDTLRPFWGGTYFPPVPAFGRPSFVQVLRRISTAYGSQRDEIRAQAATVAAAVTEKLGQPTAPVVVGPDQVTRAVETLLTIFDQVHGGFGGAPKFPQPAYLEFLLAVMPVLDDTTKAAAAKALHTTFEAMSIGGIYDHVEGGFHRYAVDATWTVPHFEKMLYDNAQLMPLYAAAAGLVELDATQSFGYEATSRGVAKFADGVMRDPSRSLYYTALDAEVDGKEGLNYLWTDESLRQAMHNQAQSDELASFASRLFGTDKGPNFTDPHHPGDPPQNVLRLAEPLRTLLPILDLSTAQYARKLADVRTALNAVRRTRKQPRLDDKVLPSQNGMHLAALARTAMLLGDESLLATASATARAIMSLLRAADGTLIRSYRDGIAEGDGLLEDYAHVIAGLLLLARAMATRPNADNRTRVVELIAQATELLAIAETAFGDAADDAGGGGYFDTKSNQADLFVRPRQTYDGALPSGQSVMLHNLIDLHELSGEVRHLDRAMRCLAGVSSAIAESPVAAINSTRGLLRLLQLLGAAEFAQRLSALGAPTAPAAPTPGKPDDVVEVLVSTDTLELDGQTPAEMFIRLEIKPGYHINSAYAAEQSGGVVVPLRIGLSGGKLDAHGQPLSLRVYADYPAGEPMNSAETVPSLSYTIHEGTVELRIVVETIRPEDGSEPANLTGNERLTLQYQACRADACLQPTKLVLPVELRGS